MKSDMLTLNSWRALFVLVQKSHFKSGSMARLTGAVDVYLGLAKVGNLEREVLKKLVSLLMHPYPKVRNAAADALYIRTGQEIMEAVDWSRAAKASKPAVERLRKTLEVG